MAGRTPRKTPDEQRGTDPLKGSTTHPGGPWQEGNRVGAGNHFKTGRFSGRALRERSEAIVTAMLTDALCPVHLHTPAFLPAVLDWGRAEAVSSLAFDHLCMLIDESGLQGAFGMNPGMMKAASEVWKAHAAFAEKLRGDLGITPAGYARVKRDLGLAGAAVEKQIADAEKAGAEIANRRLGLVQGSGEAAV